MTTKIQPGYHPPQQKPRRKHPAGFRHRQVGRCLLASSSSGSAFHLSTSGRDASTFAVQHCRDHGYGQQMTATQVFPSAISNFHTTPNRSSAKPSDRAKGSGPAIVPAKALQRPPCHARVFSVCVNKRIDITSFGPEASSRAGRGGWGGEAGK